MIKSNDSCTQVVGSIEELRLDFYNIVIALVNQGVYDNGSDVAGDVARVTGIMNMSREGQLDMLFRYDIKATLSARKSEDLMHEIRSGEDDD